MTAIICPAQAGVIPSVATNSGFSKYLSRASGGDPSGRGDSSKGVKFVPRKRG